MSTFRDRSDCSNDFERPSASTGASSAPARSGYPGPPWVQDGVDDGPARVSRHRLAAWVFAVATRDVEDWPEGLRRVRNARRFVRRRLRGLGPRRTGIEDLVFTAALIARIFDDDLHLSPSEAVVVLDALGLPTECVPLVPNRRVAASALRPAPRPIAPLQRRASPSTPIGDANADRSMFPSPRLRNAA